MEDSHQSCEVGLVLEKMSWKRSSIDTIITPDNAVVFLSQLQRGAGGEEDGVRVLSPAPDVVTGPHVDCSVARAGDDGVPRHADHTVVLGGDVNAEPLTLPVVQPE